MDFLDGKRGGLARVPDGVDEWVFTPLTEGIGVPDDTVRADPRELAGRSAGAGGYEIDNA